jgi:NAD(P)H dehydrogenase (quinone)
MAASGPLIVTGANGHLGQLVIKELLEKLKVQPSKIIAVSRTVDKLADLKKKGVDVRAGDFNDANSLKAAFKGGQRILVIVTTDFQNRKTQHETAFKEAAAAGVKHVVFTSVVTQPTNLKPFTGDLLENEAALAKIPGITHTVVGFNLWFETTLELAAGAIASGTFYTASAAGKAAYVSREDYAKACAAALASNSTTNAKFEVTGSEAIDRKTLAAIISKGLGLPKPLEVKEVPTEELVKILLAAKVPEMFAHFIAEIDRAVKDGNMATVGNGFNKLTGKQPEKFEAFIHRNKATYAPKK